MKHFYSHFSWRGWDLDRKVGVLQMSSSEKMEKAKIPSDVKNEWVSTRLISRF